MNAVLNAALEYARRGLNVIPVNGIVDGACTCSKGANCGKSAGKHPTLNQWQKRASTDPAIIKAWFASHPEYNVGIATGGASRVVALDVDGAEGRASLAALLADHGALPVTMRTKSGRADGGEHFFFRVPDELDLDALPNRVGRLGKGLDVRANGGQVVAPPSMHASGTRYVLSVNAPIAELPRWIYDLAVQEKARAKPSGAPILIEASERVETPISHRSHGMAEYSFGHSKAQRRMRGSAYAAKFDPAEEGNPVHRGKTGGTYTFERCEMIARGFDLDIETTLAILLPWAARCKPAWEPHDLRLKIIKAINEGRFEIGSLLTGAPTFKSTDAGNAERLVYEHGSDIRYGDVNGWHAWDGKRWLPNAESAVQLLAKECIQRLYDLARAQGNDALRNHAHKSEMHGALNAMVSRARHERSIRAVHSTFNDAEDAPAGNKMLLNVDNGIVDLSTGELRAHDRTRMITKLARVTYDPDAQCPTWDRFLAEAQPDAEIRAFLARLIGYSMTGETKEHSFIVHWGTGANGKTTFAETISAMLGDYARSVPTELIMAKRDDAHPCGMATLHGVRFACASETEQGRKLDVATIKKLTGGDTLTARQMRENYFEFKPTHKLHLLTNHKPRITDTTDSIWRRVHLVPWEASFRGQEDTSLPAKLAAERSGILAWAVRGCLDWLQRGLDAPASVRAATEKYRNVEDAIRAFIDDCCVIGEGHYATGICLFGAYKRWCEDRGERLIGARAFNEELRERGYEEKREPKSGRLLFLRIDLRPLGAPTQSGVRDERPS